MREMFSRKLVELVKNRKDAYLLSGDHGYALFDALRKEQPERFINAGIAEQNMVGVGSGMAKVGLYPIMYGLSSFVPIRVLEQIKIDFCYENLPGLFIGDGAGVVYSHLGTSHQSTEDISALRAIPRISILSPCDDLELEACFDWAVQQKNPVYLRMGKADLGQIHKMKLGPLTDEPIPLVVAGHKAAIFATGSMLKPCLDLIQTDKVKADLYSVPVLKMHQPIQLKKVLKPYTRVITVEEHSVYGGLGDMVAAQAAEQGTTQVKKIGIEDQFSQLCGTYDFLMKEHGLDLASIEYKIKKWLAP